MESDHNLKLRRLALYPLSYGGKKTKNKIRPAPVCYAMRILNTNVVEDGKATGGLHCLTGHLLAFAHLAGLLVGKNEI